MQSPRRAGQGRASRPPQAITGHVDREFVFALGARDRRLGVAFLVHPAVQILEEGEVGREQPLDGSRGDGRHIAELGDHPREQNHGEVTLVLADARVTKREDLVTRGGESHDPLAMDIALAVDEATRELEGELRPDALPGPPRGYVGGTRRTAHAGVSPSCTMTTSSTRMSLPA